MHHLKRAVSGLLCAVLATGVCAAAYQRTIRVSTQKIHLLVGGEQVTQAEPFLSEGTVYVPVRAVAEALGQQVGWDQYTHTVSVGTAEDVRQTLPDRTLRSFLENALQPVGSTMYVWGGGWNEEDTGAGEEAVSIGVSALWRSFFAQQNSGYDYRQTRYQIHDGLDCSGYVGWALYNTFYTYNGGEGYVMKAEGMAEAFAARGWGTYRAAADVTDHRPGDIMSSKSGHVYIVIGSCADGSVVLAHASPPGVQLCGTAAPNGTANSQAVTLATQYMRQYYPDWYAKYPNCARGTSYLTRYDQMRWALGPEAAMSDPDGLANANATQVLSLLFADKPAG